MSAQEPATSPLTDKPLPPTIAPLQPEPLALELGLGLLRLADAHAGGDLLDRVRHLREQTAREMGYVLPKIRIRDNLQIGLHEYQITLHSVPVLRGEVSEDDRSREQAAEAVVAQLDATIRSHSHELLTRQQVHQLLDQMRQTSPGLVDDVVPQLLTAGQIHQVLVSLLREDVPIRNFEAILEAIARTAEQSQDIERLVESARRSLSRVICRRLCDSAGRLPAITLDPLGEAALAETVLPGQRSETLDLSSPGIAALLDQLESARHAHASSDVPPILLCRSDLRLALRTLCQDRLPGLAVLARQEISPDVRVVFVAEIGQELLQDSLSLVAA